MQDEPASRDATPPSSGAASPRVRAEWANRVAAEYTSAALTAAVLQGCIRAGLPRPLLDTACRIVRDELDHAELSHGCLVALGGGETPIDLDFARLAPPEAPEGPLASLLDAVLRSFCFGETLAVPLFSAMRAGATHPEARAVLDRVLRDEAVHRAFGWEALDALLALDPEGVAARVAATLPKVTADFRRAYGEVPDSAPLTEEERGAGLLDAQEYRRIFQETLKSEITPRLARRGLG